MEKEDEMNDERLERKKLHTREMQRQLCVSKDGCDGQLHLKPMFKGKDQCGNRTKMWRAQGEGRMVASLSSVLCQFPGATEGGWCQLTGGRTS